MLQTLLEQCVPHSSKIFEGKYGVMTLLHINDYIIEKTFVYAIFCLSKWLGKELFEWGIHGPWPPVAPADLLHPSDPDVQDVPHEDEVPIAASLPAASSTSRSSGMWRSA